MRKTETKEFPFVLTKMDDDEGTFTGYASIFNEVDSYGDVVVPGAFKRTLKNKKQFPILWSHNITEPVGVITGQEDEKGLRVEGRLTKGVQRASELRALMRDKAVDGLSIGYQTIKEENDKESGARRLKEINLWEVSLCVFQACPGANVAEVKEYDAEDGEHLVLNITTTTTQKDPAQATPDDKGDPAKGHSFTDLAEVVKRIRKSYERK